MMPIMRLFSSKVATSGALIFLPLPAASSSSSSSNTRAVSSSSSHPRLPLLLCLLLPLHLVGAVSICDIAILLHAYCIASGVGGKTFFLCKKILLGNYFFANFLYYTSLPSARLLLGFFCCDNVFFKLCFYIML